MKAIFTLAAMSVGVFLSGCATANHGPVFDTVGPPISSSKATDFNNGSLTVYSAYEVNADFNARDPNRPEYSDYKIFTPDGKLLQKVHNNSGTILQDAMPVELPPGKFTVRARANGYGFVTIPVIIESRKTTILHLEGGSFWPDESVFNQTNAVRLPDGLVIGWKAQPEL